MGCKRAQTHPSAGKCRRTVLREYEVEMQSSGPAVRPGPKLRLGRAFCRARTKSFGLMPGSEDAIKIYYALAVGLCAVFNGRWPGSMLGSADFVRCRSGLVLGFWRNVCTSSTKVILLKFKVKVRSQVVTENKSRENVVRHMLSGSSCT